MSKAPAPSDIDEYIATFPEDVQKILSKIRATIRKAVRLRTFIRTRYYCGVASSPKRFASELR